MTPLETVPGTIAWHSGPVFSCESITRYITNVNSPDDVLLFSGLNQSPGTKMVEDTARIRCCGLG